MSKLSFRARALDPSKPMPIFLAEELPDLPDYSAINRAVPQMPSGMEKEEESEHHLQRAICAGLIIPTPEVFEIDQKLYDKNYPPDYKMPKQYIHMQPLALEQDIPDYDMDSADESWVNSQLRRLDLTPLKFEQMMDRLEKSSGQTVITLNEAKALLKQDDEVSIAVYDYWLNKRLTTMHPLILSVKTEHRPGTAQNNPYLAFRRRTEKMQTRKNRKNDEASYEKMLKLRRDLSRAVTLLEMIKRREKAKREQLHLGIEILEKRYQARDFSGQILTDLSTTVPKNTTRPAFAPIYPNQYSHTQLSAGVTAPPNQWPNNNVPHYPQQFVNAQPTVKRDAEYISGTSRKDKRQYKKRKHKNQREKAGQYVSSPGPAPLDIAASSEDEDLIGNVPGTTDIEDEGIYAFRRNKFSQYHKPLSNFGNWPWTCKDDNGIGEPKYRYTLTSIRTPRPRCVGFARRRVGRGGRIILDRTLSNMDDLWSNLDYTIYDNKIVSDLPVVVPNANSTNKIDSKSNIVSLDTILSATTSPSTITSACNNNNLVGIKNNLSETILIRTNNNNNKCNNVIKNSNNNISNDTTIEIKKEKLDDYEYDKNMISSGNSVLLNNSSTNNIVNNNGLLLKNNNCNLDMNHIKNEPMDIDEELTPRVDDPLPVATAESPAATTIHTTVSLFNHIDSNSLDNNNTENSITADILEEITNEWLHFRPKTPPPLPPMSPNSIAMERLDFELTESTPICVELQNQIATSTLLSKNFLNDNLFMSNMFSLSDIMETEPLLTTTTTGTTLPTTTSSNSLSSSANNHHIVDQLSSSSLLSANSITTTHNNNNSISVNINNNNSNKNEILNSSGDSLINELNLSLTDVVGGTGDDNEKILDNILQECQIEDLKSFHTNTNFWNGVLEDTGLLNSLDLYDELDQKNIKLNNKKLFNYDLNNKTTTMQMIGYNNNEYVNNIENRINKNLYGRNKKYNLKIGHSTYNLINSSIKDNIFKKDTSGGNQNKTNTIKLEQQMINGNASGSGTSASSSQIDDVNKKLAGGNNDVGASTSSSSNNIYNTKIKLENNIGSIVITTGSMNALTSGTILTTTNATTGSLMQLTQAQHQHLQQQHQLQQLQQQQQTTNSILVTNPITLTQSLPLIDSKHTENMIVLASPIRKQHINGPTLDRNATLQNMFKQTINVRKITTPTIKKEPDDGTDNKPKDMDCFVKVTLPDFGNNLGYITSTAQASNSNHNYSIASNSIHSHQQSQPIIVTGQQLQQNKIIINSVSSPSISSSQSSSSGASSSNQSTASILGNASNITISTPIQELLVAGQNKIQLNTIPTSNIKLNLVPTSNNQNYNIHPTNLSSLDVKTIVSGTPVQQRVKVEKTLNMLLDSEKNRILCANIKNSRGTPFTIAHINQKVVNILPIQNRNNVGSNTIQNIVTAASPTSAAALLNQKSHQRINSQSNITQQQQLQQQQLQQHQQLVAQQQALQQHHQHQQQQVVNNLNSIRIQQTGDNSVNKIVQNNDNPTVTGININTTNR